MAHRASSLRRRKRAVSAVVAILSLAGTGAVWAAGGMNGSAGIGDPFFPKAGNGGYDVARYSLDLAYQPATHRLAGRADVIATATQNLSRFDLDLRGFGVESVRVDGHAATYTRSGQELVITPKHAVAQGDPLDVTVRYQGHPQTVTDPDGSLDGWIYTPDGAWVASEPQGSPSWFPCSDHPSDKARFDVRMTVPRGLRAVSNGRLLGVQRRTRRSTFSWHGGAPMATYLATATIGRFKVQRSHFDGLRSYVAVAKGETGAGSVLGKIPAMVRFFAKKFGPYPFNDVGAIVDPSPAGYSLETQTRPLFPSVPGEITLAHELAHQWFGDSVSLETWPDIWLNEGFATWAEWLWGAHAGGATLRHDFQAGYSTPASNSDFWNPPPADPGNPAHLFDGTIYERGGMALEALRERIGNQDFLRILRRWAADHRHASATTQDFIDLAESVSGQDLTQFFGDWLYTPGKPAGYKQGGALVTTRSQGINCAGLRLASKSWNPCAQTQSPEALGRR